MNTTDELTTTDVLVIGGGGAGCRAAIEAHDLGAKVTMVLKGKFGNSGCTLHVGTSAVVGFNDDEDDSDISSLCDLISFGGFLGNQDLAKILVTETMERVEEMVDWGIDFLREDDGSVYTYRSAAHTRTRNFTFSPVNPRKHDYGIPPGMAMMDTLTEQIERRGIRVLDDTVLIDLIKGDGKVVGATVLDCETGSLKVVTAKSTVLATGTYSQIFSPTTVSPFETGDGHAAAYRVGAELTSMEASQFVATSIPFPPGTKFLNSLGEEFLPKYGIDNPRDFAKEPLAYAVWKEIMSGRGFKGDNIMLDLSNIQEPESFPWFMDNVERSIKKTGRDPRTEPVESHPKSHTTMGGIVINERCETTVPGLYACGAVAGGVYGHARPEGYTSMITLVFGKRGGEYAAQQALDSPEPVLDMDEITASFARANAGVDELAVTKASDIKRKIKLATKRYAWVIKDEEGLSKGLCRIQALKEEVATLRAATGRQWARTLEARNLLWAVELHFIGALARKESRGAFFRDDYPDTEPGWLKNIIYSQVDGSLVMGYREPELKYCDPSHHGAPKYRPTSHYGVREYA